MQQNCRKIASFLLKGRRNTQIYHVFANSAFVYQNWVKKLFGKPFKSTDKSTLEVWPQILQNIFSLLPIGKVRSETFSKHSLCLPRAMAKWSSPSAFRACPQLTQGPNLWSFLFPSLQDCTSSVKLVGDPSEPSWFSSASQNLVREGQGRCIFPWVTLAPPGSKQGTNSQSFDKSGCRNWRQEDKEGPFFFFFLTYSNGSVSTQEPTDPGQLPDGAAWKSF